MKRFFVLTLLTLMVCTAHLYCSPSYADVGPADNSSNGDYGWAEDRFPFEEIYGYVWVMVWYDPDTRYAYSSHHFFLRNEGWNLIRWYSHMECNLKGPGFGFAPKEKKDRGWLGGLSEKLDSQRFAFDLTRRLRGKYTIEGSTSLVIKADLNGDGNFDAADDWDADADLDFKVADNK